MPNTVGSEHLSICVACGTQYDVPIDKPPENCPICDDPRQFIPPQGQTWTSIGQLREMHKNRIIQDEVDERIWSIFTEPQVAIGQRAVLLETPEGNMLWDCISYLDQETVDFINSRGGLKAIAISHPHFYSSHLDWAHEFDCPVYLASDDKQWLVRSDTEGRRRFVEGLSEEILPGVTIAKLGGHFPGSSILHWENTIVTGDTIGISLSGLYRKNRPAENQVFFFQWSFPNFIPLGPDAMQQMWERLQPFEFHTVHSLFYGRTVRDSRVKGLILESMQRQAKHQQNDLHQLLSLRVPSPGKL